MSLLRDQLRARHAYTSAAEVPPRDRGDYKIVVNDFGAHVIRTGLCAAVAWLQRRGAKPTDRAAELFLTHLDAAAIRGLPAVTGKARDSFATKVQTAAAADYMIATRDALALVVWFRRAVQTWQTEDHEDRDR